jgi:hypothetical protein
MTQGRSAGEGPLAGAAALHPGTVRRLGSAGEAVSPCVPPRRAEGREAMMAAAYWTATRAVKTCRTPVRLSIHRG